MIFLILVLLGWFLYLFTAFNTASCDGIYPSMVSDSSRRWVSVILMKYELKQLSVSLSSGMILSSSTKSNFSLEFSCSEKKGLNVFQKCLSLPTTVGSRLS